MDEAERTEKTDLLLLSVIFFSLSFGAHKCSEIFENIKQNTNPEAPTPWLALMGMKHSSRCLLLRRKMAENAAESTEVRTRGKARHPSSPIPRAPLAETAPSADKVSRILRHAPASAVVWFSACAPFPPGTELCAPADPLLAQAASRKPPLYGFLPGGSVSGSGLVRGEA